MDVIGTCLYSDGSTMLITIERLKALVRVQTRLVALSRRTHLVPSQQDRQVGTFFYFFSPKKCLAWHWWVWNLDANRKAQVWCFVMSSLPNCVVLAVAPVVPGELPKSHSSSGDEGGGGHQTPGNSARQVSHKKNPLICCCYNSLILPDWIEVPIHQPVKWDGSRFRKRRPFLDRSASS